MMANTHTRGAIGGRLLVAHGEEVAPHAVPHTPSPQGGFNVGRTSQRGSFKSAVGYLNLTLGGEKGNI